MTQGNLLDSSSRPYAYRATLNASTAVPLGENSQDLTELVFQADPANTDNVKIGSATVQCHVLEPGDIYKWPVRNPGLIWGISASGTQYVNTTGREGE